MRLHMRTLWIAFASASILATALAGHARAGVVVASDSTTRVLLGTGQGLSYVATDAYGGHATLSNNGGSHDIFIAASFFKTTGAAAGTSLFTGVPLLTDLVVTATNQSGTLTASFSAANSLAGNLTGPNQTAYSGTICPLGCLGGNLAIDGQTVILVAGAPFAFPNSAIGVGGVATLMLAPGATIAITGAPFVTGEVRITNVTSNVIQLPNRSPVETGVFISLDPTSMELRRSLTTMGGFASTNPSGQLQTRATVTVSGTNVLASASNAGQVTLVSPLRVDTGPLGVGVIPGKVAVTLVVPEPGTLGLLVSGAAMLVAMGYRRRRH